MLLWHDQNLGMMVWPVREGATENKQQIETASSTPCAHEHHPGEREVGAHIAMLMPIHAAACTLHDEVTIKRQANASCLRRFDTRLLQSTP